MKQRKYKEAYRIVSHTDARTGRERRDAEYTGAHYRFPEGSPAPRRRALRLAPVLAVYWLAALAWLKTAGITGRCVYALPPFLLGLFPGAYSLMGLVSMLRAPERMTVVQRETGVGRLMRSGLGCGIFSAVGAVGGVVCVSVAGRWGDSWHEPLLTSLAAAAGFFAFRLARRDYRALEEDPGGPAGRA